jgi:hypothetical protein
VAAIAAETSTASGSLRATTFCTSIVCGFTVNSTVRSSNADDKRKVITVFFGTVDPVTSTVRRRMMMSSRLPSMSGASFGRVVPVPIVVAGPVVDDGDVVPGTVVPDPGTVDVGAVDDGAVDDDGTVVDVAPVASLYRTQRITWLICLSPFFPPLSMMPFLLESGQTTEPAEGAMKTVFTWKFGSVDVSDPAFTLTRL